MSKLYFYYSAMNAGKSTTLLQSDYNYRERGMRTLLFTPHIDDRYGKARITSRIGLQADAIAFGSDNDLFSEIREQHRDEHIDCVLIDEAQFLTQTQVLQLSLVVDKLDIPVLCYGLRTDFRGEPFEGSKYLLAWADMLVELKTVCTSGRKATFNARLDAEGERVWEGEQIEIGHNYVAMSRKVFELHKVSPVDYEMPAEAPRLEAASTTAAPEQFAEA